MLDILIIFVWLFFGYFSARLAYLDMESGPFAWVFFFMGLIGFAIGFCMSDKREEALYLNKIPLYVFLKNHNIPDFRITERFFRVGD